MRKLSFEIKQNDNCSQFLISNPSVFLSSGSMHTIFTHKHGKRKKKTRIRKITKIRQRFWMKRVNDSACSQTATPRCVRRTLQLLNGTYLIKKNIRFFCRATRQNNRTQISRQVTSINMKYRRKNRWPFNRLTLFALHPLCRTDVLVCRSSR